MAPMRPIDYTTLTHHAETVQPIYVMDIETTGLSFDHEIVELGVHRLSDGFTWNTLVRPERSSADETAHITGINDEMVADAPTIDEALMKCDKIAPLDNAIIIAHNGHMFDIPRINNARDRSSFVTDTISPDNVIDTLHLAQKIIPWGGISNYKLTTLLEYFDLPSDQSHRAGDDCEDTARVFARLLGVNAQLAVPPYSVGDLIDMSRTPRTPTRKEKELRRVHNTIRRELDRPDMTAEKRRYLIQGYEDMYYQCYEAVPDLRSL